jgi:hypothetical protein
MDLRPRIWNDGVETKIRNVNKSSTYNKEKLTKRKNNTNILTNSVYTYQTFFQSVISNNECRRGLQTYTCPANGFFATFEELCMLLLHIFIYTYIVIKKTQEINEIILKYIFSNFTYEFMLILNQ